MSPTRATKSVQLAVFNAIIAINAVILAKFARKGSKCTKYKTSKQKNNSDLIDDDMFLGSHA